MILVDTSVWIEYFRQQSEYVQELRPLLAGRMVAAIEPVFAELIYGVRNKRERMIIEKYWNVLPRIPFSPGTMMDAAAFSNVKNYHSKGIGVIDAILVKAVTEGDHLLWTLDSRIIRNIDHNLLYKLDQ